MNSSPDTLKKELRRLSSEGKVSKLVQSVENHNTNDKFSNVTLRGKNLLRSKSTEPNFPTPPIRKSLFEKQAVQIYKEERGRYFLDIDIMNNIFGKVKDKLIAIYSISGKFRSGKSFLLNIFTKYLLFGEREDWIDIPINDCFKYKCTDKRVTTGIWIWSEPVIKKIIDGRDVAIFLMDTQGWHDDQTNSRDSALVFALSSLMSSVMIFNLEKRIGEDDLHYLQTYSSNAKLIDEKNNDESFQKLVFLIRDWQFAAEDGFDYGYYDSNTWINGKNFKRDRISSRSDQSDDARSIREIIEHIYPDISAYLMPYPGSAIQSNTFNYCEADSVFVEHLKRFTRLLFDENTIVPKLIGNRFLTGSDFLERVHNWALEFKYDPTIMESFGTYYGVFSGDETHCQMAFQSSLDYFDEKIKKFLNNCQTIEDFKGIRQKIKDLMLQSEALFHAYKKVKNAKLRAQFAKKLKGELDERELSYKSVVDYEISLKKSEIERKAKEEELAQMKIKNLYKDNEEIYGVFEAQVMEMMSKEEENRKFIRETMYEFQQQKRKKRKNWFRRFLERFRCPRVKTGNLIEL